LNAVPISTTPLTTAPLTATVIPPTFTGIPLLNEPVIPARDARE